jgi:hypothetical protein
MPERNESIGARKQSTTVYVERRVSLTIGCQRYDVPRLVWGVIVETSVFVKAAADRAAWGCHVLPLLPSM